MARVPKPLVLAVGVYILVSSLFFVAVSLRFQQSASVDVIRQNDARIWTESRLKEIDQSNSNISRSQLSPYQQKFDLVSSMLNPTTMKSSGVSIPDYAPTLGCFEVEDAVTSYKNAIIDPSKAFRITGKERDEFFGIRPGFLTLFCADQDAKIPELNSRDNVRAKVEISDKYPRSQVTLEVETLVIVTREEYANVYWTIMDNFDIYHTLLGSGIEPRSAHILWLDDHPPSSIDPLWDQYFKSIIRIASLEKSGKLFAKNLVLRPNRNRSLMKQMNRKIAPQMDSFRGYINSSLTKQKEVNCEQVHVLIIWRRDYVNHPGNPAGIISRKISNEQDVITAMNELPNVRLMEAQLDQLHLKTQLELFSRADVVFGMHGAGHALTMFMQKGGVVVEICSPDKTRNWHMEHISRNSGHLHIKHGLKEQPDANKSFFIPKDLTRSLMQKALKHLCPTAIS